MGDLLFGSEPQQQIVYPPAQMHPGQGFAEQWWQNFAPWMLTTPMPSYPGQVDPGLSPSMQALIRQGQNFMSTPTPNISGMAAGLLGPYMQPPQGFSFQDSWAGGSLKNFGSPTITDPSSFLGPPRDPTQPWTGGAQPGPWGRGGGMPGLPSLPSPMAGSVDGQGPTINMQPGANGGPWSMPQGVGGVGPGPPMGPPGGGPPMTNMPSLAPPYTPVQHRPTFVGFDPFNPMPWLQSPGGWMAPPFGPSPYGGGGGGASGGGAGGGFTPGQPEAWRSEGYKENFPRPDAKIAWFGRWSGPNKGKTKREVVFDMWTRGWPMGKDYEPPPELVKQYEEQGLPTTFGGRVTTPEEIQSAYKEWRPGPGWAPTGPVTPQGAQGAQVGSYFGGSPSGGGMGNWTPPWMQQLPGSAPGSFIPWNPFARPGPFFGPGGSTSRFMRDPRPMMRAGGGPVGDRRPYLVGELGPELFVPDRNGQVVDHETTRMLLSKAVPRQMGGAAHAGGAPPSGGGSFFMPGLSGLAGLGEDDPLARALKRGRWREVGARLGGLLGQSASGADWATQRLGQLGFNRDAFAGMDNPLGAAFQSGDWSQVGRRIGNLLKFGYRGFADPSKAPAEGGGAQWARDLASQLGFSWSDPGAGVQRPGAGAAPPPPDTGGGPPTEPPPSTPPAGPPAGGPPAAPPPTGGGPFGPGGYSPGNIMDIYRNAAGVMDIERDAAVKDALAAAGATGNRFSTATENTVADIGGQYGLRKNQLMSDLLYRQTQSDLDRALQATGMQMQNDQFRNQLGWQAWQNSLDRPLQAFPQLMNAIGQQHQMGIDKLQVPFDIFSQEQQWQNMWNMLPYQDWQQNKLGYLPYLFNMIGGIGPPYQGGGVPVTSGGSPGLLDFASEVPWGEMIAAGMFSDERLKEDIRPAKKRDLSARLLQLKPKTWQWKGGGGEATGFIAQDVEKILPAAVLEHPSGYKMIDYGLLAAAHNHALRAAA